MAQVTDVAPAGLKLAPARPARRRRSAGMLVMSVPAVVWYALFTIGPLLAMFYIALLKWRGLIAPASFTGFSNFAALWHDAVFWTAARNSLIQLIVVLTFMLPLAFMLGYYVALKPPGHRILRVILFTPALVSLSAKSMIFVAVFAPNGMINGMLNSLGLHSWAQPWLANVHTALPTVIAVDLWSGIGYTAILFAARMSSVSPDLYEAAQLDGASHWRRMWGITYPIVRDYFGVLLMLQFLWVLFSSAGSVLLLTNGGPGNSSTTLSFLMYDKAFSQSQVGYSQAVGVVLFTVGVVGMVVIRRIFRPTH